MTLRTAFSISCLGWLALMGRLEADDKLPAPVNPPVFGATVLGKDIDLNKYVYRVEVEEQRKKLPAAEFEVWLRSHHAARLFDQIKMRVMQDYATREKFSPSDEELGKFFQDARRKYPENFETTDEKTRRRIALRAAMALAISKDWRLARALHQKFGGRVALSSFGAIESFEGRNAVLQEYFDRGDIKFHRPDLQQAFFEKMKDERIQDVTLPIERTREYFQEPPPWEKWLAEQAKKSEEIKAERKAEAKPEPPLPK